MKKLIILGIALIGGTTIAQTDINDARTNFSQGQIITIKGVAANGSELGPIRYIQDNTGGLAAYSTSQTTGISLGDSVEITGPLSQFGGAIQISPINTVNNFGQANQIAPLLVGIANLGPNIEGRLIQIDNVTFPGAGGNFTVSGSGTNYPCTDGSNTVDLRINPNSNINGSAIPTGPQTVVGLLSQFNGTYQILPRTTADIFTYSPPDKEIVVNFEGNNLFTGDEYVVGTTTTTNFQIQNLGINPLTISSVNLTGPNASEFTTSLTTGTVAANGTNNYTLTFTPSGNGTKLATLVIGNDDADENPFEINLYAVGLDGLATEPSSLPTNLTFSNVEAYTLTGSYTASLDAEKYLVIYKLGSAPVANPVDGVEYQKGDIINDAVVAYVGAGTGFVPRGVRANRDYHYAVYPFSGSSTFTNYNTSAPLFGNVISSGSNIGNYYAGINAENNPNLISDLTALINPHNYITYFLYKNTVMEDFEIRDTTENRSVVTCAYTGENLIFSGAFDWTQTGYSREHTYAHSWMPTFTAGNSEDLPQYSDQHNLYPTNLQQANSPRSNLPLGEITGNTVFNYLEGSVGEIVPGGSLVYEPRDAQKGNAARAIFYMATAYEGINGNDWSIPSNQDEQVLKNWHFADAPDDYEIARHEYIYSVQDNRNPFVDSANYACYINFNTMNYIPTGCGTLGLSPEIVENDLVVFPNPSSDDVYIQVNGLKLKGYKVLNLQGQVVEQAQQIDAEKVVISGSELGAGTYIIQVETDLGNTTKRVVIK